MCFFLPKANASQKDVCSNNEPESVLEQEQEQELETRQSPQQVASNTNTTTTTTTTKNMNGTDDDTRSDVAITESNPRYLDSPTIVNNTEYPIVVFLERGILYNKQVLRPGEALTMTRKQTGGFHLRLPYRVHAVLGDEKNLPSQSDSLKNLAKASVIPAAFVAGCLATAVTAGALAGPSLALAPLVSGMVVSGVVVDTAALAGGAMAANTAKKVAAVVLKDHKEKLMGVTDNLQPGRKYLSVTGGLKHGPIKIDNISRRAFDKLELMAIKGPEPRVKPRLEKQLAASFRFQKKQQSGILSLK